MLFCEDETFNTETHSDCLLGWEVEKNRMNIIDNICWTMMLLMPHLRAGSQSLKSGSL